jgi:hypothetical protein
LVSEYQQYQDATAEEEGEFDEEEGEEEAAWNERFDWNGFLRIKKIKHIKLTCVVVWFPLTKDR